MTPMRRAPTTLERLKAEGRLPESGWDRYVRKFPERAAFYKSGPWHIARARHLREHPTCVICGEAATVVDHIVPRAEYGADVDPTNLQSMCKRHHRTKTQRESARGRKRAAQQRKNPQGRNEPISTDPGRSSR